MHMAQQLRQRFIFVCYNILTLIINYHTCLLVFYTIRDNNYSCMNATRNAVYTLMHLQVIRITHSFRS